MADKFPTTDEVIADVRRIASDYGYALGVHGSLKRDLDLIAAPWVTRARAASSLARAVGMLPYLRMRKDDEFQPPISRPHGRLGWVYYVVRSQRETPFYVDLSVMPRRVSVSPARTDGGQK